MTVLYNEIEPYCAQWIRNLSDAGHIAPGQVDTRSVVDLRPADVAGYAQFHTFAGIAGWSLALRLAGVPDDFPVWTGSCPCQPFSAAGRHGGFSDERHLWPAWFELIDACRPPLVLGEQVASDAGLGWLDTVVSDLERAGYAVWACIVPALAVGRPHLRDRLWFVAYAPGHGCEGLQRRTASQIPEDRAPEALGARNCAGDPFANWQELLAGTEVRRLADGVSSYLAVRPALRAYGNAIDPQVAADFIAAALDALTDQRGPGMTIPQIPADGAVEAKRDHRRPETYPPLPDLESETVISAADGRPWRKACADCLLRTSDPQGVGDSYQHIVRHSRPDRDGLFYCNHRTDNGEHRVCACFAACRAGEAARALPLTSKEDRT